MRLDKRIVIEVETTSKNAVGTPIETWTTLRECAANVYVRTGGTERDQAGSLPFQRVEFQIRYVDEVNYKCRILYEDAYYLIDYIETIGRKHWLKISSIVFPGQLSNG